MRRLNATNPDTNAWARLERSEVDLDEFGELFAAEARAAATRSTAARCSACWPASCVPRWSRRSAGARSGSPPRLLTNNFVPGMDDDNRFPEVLALFDAVVESSKVGVRKPDPRFYEIACELAEVEPTEVVFLDDLGVNLKPARAMGMTTIKVTDPAVAFAELEQVVGFPLSD